MAKIPYMPFFCDAYMLDAGHLTEAEHGAYLRLLILAWNTPNCRIPNDNEWLARKLGKTVDIVENLYRPLIDEFWQSNGNWLWQARQLREYLRIKDTSKNQSVRAKSRWKNKKDLCPSDAGKSAPAMPPTPTPTLRKKDKKEDTDSASKNGSSDAAANASDHHHRYAFEGKVIKLNQRDFDKWRIAYPDLELVAELQSLDDWIASESPDKRKRWFHLISGALKNRQVTAAKKKPPPRPNDLQKSAYARQVEEDLQRVLRSEADG